MALPVMRWSRPTGEEATADQEQLGVDADGPAPERCGVSERLLDGGGKGLGGAGDAHDAVTGAAQAEVHRRVGPEVSSHVVVSSRMSVLNVPVTMTDTPRPNGAISWESDSPHRSRAPLTPEYAPMAGMPRMAPWLDTSTIRPRPAARIDGISAFVSRTGPKRLVENICSQVSMGISSMLPTPRDAGVVHDAVGRPDALDDLGRRRRDGLVVVEVEPDRDEARVVVRRPRPRPAGEQGRVRGCASRRARSTRRGGGARRWPGPARGTHR